MNTGDGNSTFNLPNLGDRVPILSPSFINDGYSDNGFIPNIKTTGNRLISWFSDSTAELIDGPIYRPAGVGFGLSGANWINSKPSIFNASMVSSVYKDGKSYVLPAYLHCLWCIKY